MDNFEQLIDTAMRLLTNVSTMTYIKNVPSVAKANKLMHSVGLGVMNLHGHLVTQGIRYGSVESIAFVDAFMEAVNYYSLKSSMEHARKSGKVFYRFEDSEYASSAYFEQYVGKEEKELPKIVLEALGKVPLITKQMWVGLKEEILKYGLFHSYRLAIAPTGK